MYFLFVCLSYFPQAEQERETRERDGATYSSSTEESSDEGDSSDDNDPAGESVEDGRSVERGASRDNMEDDARSWSSSEPEDTVKV